MPLERGPDYPSNAVEAPDAQPRQPETVQEEPRYVTALRDRMEGVRDEARGLSEYADGLIAGIQLAEMNRGDAAPERAELSGVLEQLWELRDEALDAMNLDTTGNDAWAEKAYKYGDRAYDEVEDIMNSIGEVLGWSENEVEAFFEGS